MNHKKIVIATALLCLLFIFNASISPALAAISDAQTNAVNAVAGTPLANQNVAQFPALVGTIIQVVLGMVGVLFLILVIWSGVSWMLAAGDSAKITKAKGVLIAAVIGLIITMTAYAITVFVLQSVGAAEVSGSNPAQDTRGTPNPNVVDPARPNNPDDNWTLHE